MIEKFRLKGGIYEVKFGYHFKMGGYTEVIRHAQLHSALVFLKI